MFLQLYFFYKAPMVVSLAKLRPFRSKKLKNTQN